MKLYVSGARSEVPVMGARVEFRLLGPVEAWNAGQRVTLGERRQRSVAAVLLTEANRVVSASSMIERVWGEQPPASARSALYSYLTRIRTVLAEPARLTRSSGGYVPEVDPDAVDLHLFDRLVERARATEDADRATVTWAAALELWRGEPYEDLSSPWLDQMRDAAHQRWLTAVADRNEVELARGRHAELLADLTDLCERQPYDERLSGQLMLAAYRCGRQAEALRRFDAVRRRLADELGVDPSPQLQRLHQRILAADPTLNLSSSPTAERPLPVVPAAAMRLDRAAWDLARAVDAQWTAEAETRSVRRPAPVRVRWAATGRPVAASAPERIPRGDVTDVAAKFKTLAVPQLVVLGQPGAGKTVLATLLALGLLADREAAEPVPVLLSLSSWNPHRDHLHTWLARRLLEDYPGLGNTRAYGPGAATRLVTEGRVLPILDGLDEMPPALHAVAIDALDRAAAGGRPLVVTCRTAEYVAAVRRDGAVLAGAAVVELEPVALDEAVAFLTARLRSSDSRWQPVVEHLRRRPAGPLAQTLSTPLMVDLARTAYARPAADPAELLDTERFPERAAIEDHLLDAFLPATYTQRPAPPAPALRSPTPRRYRPDRAHRWLTALAGHLARRQTHELAWWRLVDTIPGTVRGLLFGLPIALLFAICGLLVAGPRMALTYGVATGLASCIAHGMGTRREPVRVEMRFGGRTVRLLAQCAVGVLIGLAIGVVWRLPLGSELLLVAVFGACLGLNAWLDAPPDASHTSSPATALRQDRLATLAFAVSVGLPLGAFYALTVAVSQPAGGTAPLAQAFHVERAVPAALVSALFGWFAFRRLGSLCYGLAGFVVGGQAMPHDIAIGTGLGAGAVFGCAIGLIAALSRSWGAFVLGRTWLAVRGRTPLRLNRFLADAHQRGVLRQAGPTYQFRHARLRDRLVPPVRPGMLGRDRHAGRNSSTS